MIKLYLGIFKNEEPVMTIRDQYFWLNSNIEWAEHQAEMQKRFREVHHPEQSTEYDIYEVVIKKTRRKK